MIVAAIWCGQFYLLQANAFYEGQIYSNVTVGTSEPPRKRRENSKKQEKRVLA